MKKQFDSAVEQADSVCILGHINPDGDCVGSVLALWNYIRSRWPEKTAVAVLDSPSPKFSYLNGFSEIHTDCDTDRSYGLCIVCDCADEKRLGKFDRYLSSAKTSFLADHHITNRGFCDQFVIRPEASSTSEIVFGLIGEENLTREIAACIYTGIIHDTGVFKYSCTSRRTMEIAGICMEKGIDFGRIIDDSFYTMRIDQRRLLGTVLQRMESALDGKMVYAILDRQTMLEAGISEGRDTDGFIDNIRTTEGAVCGAFFYQTADGRYKASLRSNSEFLNVAEIASRRSGGGHRMAAGCFLSGDVRQAVDQVIAEVQQQICPPAEPSRSV